MFEHEPCVWSPTGTHRKTSIRYRIPGHQGLTYMCDACLCPLDDDPTPPTPCEDDGAYENVN